MRAVTVVPGSAGSMRVGEVPEPDPALGSVLVEAVAVGICGTDAEIADGGYGWPPPGRDRLILGHESHGHVVDPGPSGLEVGEHVVGIVRRPDAQLILVPKDPRKEPKIWAIHHLDLESVGFNRAMPFEATLTNPIPKGEIA